MTARIRNRAWQYQAQDRIDPLVRAAALPARKGAVRLHANPILFHPSMDTVSRDFHAGRELGSTRWQFMLFSLACTVLVPYPVGDFRAFRL